MNNKKKLSDDIYKHILNMIFTLQLKPGDRIPEAEIARDLSVSRTPIREAIRQLANDGVVTILANKHAKVSDYSDDYIKNIGEMRLFFELISVLFADYYGSTADFDKLQQIATECCNAAKHGNNFERLRKDAEFHLELATCSNNTILHKFQTQLNLQVLLIQANKHNSPEEIAVFCKYQERVIKHLKDHDLAGLFKTIKKHYISYYGLEKYFPAGFFDILNPKV